MDSRRDEYYLLSHEFKRSPRVLVRKEILQPHLHLGGYTVIRRNRQQIDIPPAERPTHHFFGIINVILVCGNVIFEFQTNVYQHFLQIRVGKGVRKSKICYALNIFWCFKFKTKRKYIVDSVVDGFVTYTVPLEFSGDHTINRRHPLAVHFSLAVEIDNV
jgi:hypothetical protein